MADFSEAWRAIHMQHKALARLYPGTQCRSAAAGGPRHARQHTRSPAAKAARCSCQVADGVPPHVSPRAQALPLEYTFATQVLHDMGSSPVCSVWKMCPKGSWVLGA